MANNDETEIWLRMYEEQIRHIRHHELLRASATNITIVISAAALGLYAADAVATRYRWVFALLLGIANAYGFLMSLKHYERSQLHQAVSAGYRKKIARKIGRGPHRLDKVRRLARAKHHRRRPRMHRVRAYLLWSTLHVVLLLLAVGLLVSEISPNAPRDIATPRQPDSPPDSSESR